MNQGEPTGNQLRIGFIGAGAIGGYFGAKLHEVGQDVVFKARGNTAQLLIDEGLRVIDERGDRQVRIPTTTDPAELDCDVVILATKALRGVDDVQELLDGIPENALVVTTQNAVEFPQAVADIVGQERAVPGVARGFIHLVEPGHVEFHGGPLSLNIGTWDGSPNGTVDALAKQLNAAGIASQVLPNIWVDVWEKAMFVSTFGALGALSGHSLEKLRTDMRGSLALLMYEIDAVAHAMEVPLSEDVVERILGFADSMPATATSSMQRDFLDGKASELDAQVGAIVRLGRKFDVPTPAHQLAYEVLKSKAQ